MAMIAFSNAPHGKKKIPHCDEDQVDTWGPISVRVQQLVLAVQNQRLQLRQASSTCWSRFSSIRLDFHDKLALLAVFPTGSLLFFLNDEYFWLIKYLLLSLLAEPLCTWMNRKYACSSSSWAHAKSGGGPGWDGWVMWRDGSWKKAGCYAWAGCRWGGWGVWGGWTQEELEDESMDLKAASGPRGCRSRCCLPSLWLSSVWKKPPV